MVQKAVIMKRCNSYKGGRPFPTPFIAAAAIVTIFYIVAGFALAGEPAPNIQGKGVRPETMSLTLDQAISMSMKENRDIADSRYTAESQRYSIESADSLFDLKLIPAGGVNLNGGDYSDYNNVSAGLQLQKRLIYGTSVSIAPQITRSTRKSVEQYTADVGVTVTQPLLRGLGKEITTDGLQSARAAYETSLRNLYQTRVNTVLDTISAFYAAVRQMELLGLYEKMRARLEGYSEIARAKEKVGLSTPMDTYRVEILINDTEDAIITASELLQNSKDSLKLILSMPQDTELELIIPESPVRDVTSLDNAVETALAKRIEMEQIKQDISEAERRTAIKKQEILPDLNLVLKYGRYDTAYTMEQSTGLDHNRYSIGLHMTSDISRTAEKAAYQQSLISIKRLATDAENRKEDISAQVRSRWLSLHEAVKRIEVRNIQIEQGEEKLALAEVKFAHGMADNFDVIEAEKELQNARGNLLAAEIDYAIGIYNLKAVMGTLVQRN